MREYEKKFNYKVYRFIWLKFRRISIWAGKQMIVIAKEYSK